MARAGRKRKFKAKRRQTTAAGQGRNKLKATPERLNHFEAATGRKRRNNYDDGDATPIHMLFDKKLITQEQKSAALDYAELYWHYISGAFKRDNCVTFAKQLVGKGSVVMPADVLDEAGEERERRFKEVDARLNNKGQKVRRYLHKVVLDEVLPDFYGKKEYTFNDLQERSLLQTGLNALVER